MVWQGEAAQARRGCVRTVAVGVGEVSQVSLGGVHNGTVWTVQVSQDRFDVVTQVGLDGVWYGCMRSGG
jgi:hypothetical protein